MLSDLQVHWDPVAGARLPEKRRKVVSFRFPFTKVLPNS